MKKFFDKCQIDREHLNSNREDLRRKHQQTQNQIGGLLLLPRNLNTSSGALPFEQKRDHYFGQNLLAGSMTPLAYQNNPGFLRFIAESGLSFHGNDQFGKADLDDRYELYRSLAGLVWNPSDLMESQT